MPFPALAPACFLTTDTDEKGNRLANGNFTAGAKPLAKLHLSVCKILVGGSHSGTCNREAQNPETCFKLK